MKCSFKYLILKMTVLSIMEDRFEISFEYLRSTLDGISF